MPSCVYPLFCLPVARVQPAATELTAEYTTPHCIPWLNSVGPQFCSCLYLITEGVVGLHWFVSWVWVFGLFGLATMQVKVLWLVLCLSNFECRGIWDCLLEALTLLAHATVKNSFLLLLNRKQMQKSPPESALWHPHQLCFSFSFFLHPPWANFLIHLNFSWVVLSQRRVSFPTLSR